MPSSLSEFERLFLLEFFVDYVTIQNISFNYEESKLCVSFQFLHYPMMRVCEEDFKPATTKPVAEDSKIVFKSGKSCMFSVHPDENNTISSNFNLIIVVCQKREGCTQLEQVGYATVNLGNSFLNLLQPSANVTMDSGAKHDLFPLKDKFKRTVGSVAAFARLSNFGKIIVTQFHLAEEGDPNYMFKGTDPSKLFKDDPAMRDFPKISNDEPRPSMESKPKPPPRQSNSKRLPSTPPPSLDSGDDESDSCESETTETEVGDGSEKDSKGGKGTEGGDGVDSDSEDRYKEIAAEVNGNNIVIRLLKKHKNTKKSSQTEQVEPVCCSLPEPPICPFAPKLNVCDCDFPLPPEMIPRCPPQCCQAPPPCPPQCCQAPPPCPPQCCQALPPCPPPPPCCLAPQNSGRKSKSNSLPNNMAPNQKLNSVNPGTCPREDCPLNLHQILSSAQD